MTINPTSILKVTFQTTSNTFQKSNTWVINTRKDVDYTTLTVTDEKGSQLTPVSEERKGVVYILVFSSSQFGKAVFEY